MNFSIIIPVYNVEQYIDKCLKNIEKQSYNKFEVIIVNDGSPDHSMDIIEKYVKKDNRFKVFTKENGGLSDARNYGIERASGDIIVLIDSDDYIDEDLLVSLKEEFEKSREIEVVRYQLRLIDQSDKVIEQPQYDVFSNLPSVKAYPILLKNAYVDVAWAYAYERHFFTRNKFQYAKGKIHEDLGLTHLVLVKAKNISSIDYVGYNYVQRAGSIMTTSNHKHNLRKIYDTLFHFDRYMEILQNDSSIAESNRDALTDYLVKAVIWRSKTLKGRDRSRYIKELQKRKIYKYFPNQSLKDKVIRLIIRFSLRSYIIKNVK